MNTNNNKQDDNEKEKLVAKKPMVNHILIVILSFQFKLFLTLL